MSKKKKILLIVILAVVIAGHLWLFAAGGSLRTAGIVLVIVDVITGFMVIGAIQEFKKLEKK
jgi:hypothetical protein